MDRLQVRQWARFWATAPDGPAVVEAGVAPGAGGSDGGAVASAEDVVFAGSGPATNATYAHPPSARSSASAASAGTSARPACGGGGLRRLEGRRAWPLLLVVNGRGRVAQQQAVGRWRDNRWRDRLGSAAPGRAV